VPRLIAPAANARVPYGIEFTWSRALAAQAYTIQVAEDETFTNPLLVDDTAEARSYSVDLCVPGPVWWRVRGMGAGNAPGPWSETRKLEIVRPPLATSVFRILVNPASVPAGASADGTITLTEPAPTGGATVLLSSSYPSIAKVPPWVVFAAGETSVPFSIDTPPSVPRSVRRLPARRLV